MKVFQKLIAVILTITLCTITVTGCSAGGDSKTKTIEVFVFKPESVKIFQELGEKFEKENPDIKVSVNSPGDAYAILKARMVKGNPPDIVGLDATQAYVDYAKADIFEDLTNSEIIDKVKPSYVQMLANMEGLDGKVHAVPFAANVTGVLYDIDKFEKLNLKVPTTWQELKKVCKKIQDAGETPFYLGYKEDWVINCAWNPLAGNFTTADFYQNVTDGTDTFEKAYEEPLKRILELNDYSQGDIFSYNYNNATVGFANGESVMYMQGNWAIPMVLQTNPDMNLGMFPLPALDNAQENKLCSSIDLMFSVTKQSKYPKESARFLEFLTSQENVNLYMEDQFGIPAIDCDFEFPETMDGVVEDFNNENIVSSPQAYYPSEMKVSIALQTYMIDGNKDQLFQQFNAAWRDAHEE